MDESDELIFTLIFKNFDDQKIVFNKKGKEKIGKIIKEYLQRIQKSNLLMNSNIDTIYFVSNGETISSSVYEKKVDQYFRHNLNEILVYNSYSKINYEIVKTIKDNFLASVYKVKLLDNFEGKYAAVKKIFKDKIKEQLKIEKCKIITEEDFKHEIIKFNKEIENMKRCYCENSVKIIDYYDTEKEFIIIMELCDETLLDILCRTKDGFNAEQIKNVLLQLNNTFKMMNKYNISHRDIKLNNILVKYLNKDKTKYKILLSDYGVSNHLNSFTQYHTHVGTKLIMAPEILDNKPYNNKCDLWSLGIIIYQLYTKEYPYHSPVEKGILEQIENKGKKVLTVIKDENLKDLLSKLLEKNPKKRISWKDYFNHPFFGGKALIQNNTNDSCIIY